MSKFDHGDVQSEFALDPGVLTSTSQQSPHKSLKRKRTVAAPAPAPPEENDAVVSKYAGVSNRNLEDISNANSSKSVSGSVSWNSLSVSDMVKEMQIPISTDSSFLHTFDLLYEVWCNIPQESHANLERLTLLYGRPTLASLSFLDTKSNMDMEADAKH